MFDLYVYFIAKISLYISYLTLKTIKQKPTILPAPHPLHVSLAVGAGPVVIAHCAYACVHYC